MKKFTVVESKPAIQCWTYTIEAESEEQAIEMIREGLVDCEDTWMHEDPFERYDYEVSSDEEV